MPLQIVLSNYGNVSKIREGMQQGHNNLSGESKKGGKGEKGHAQPSTLLLVGQLKPPLV
jgi:hypothetical protein